MERSNEVESSKPPEARKNASETLAIGFNFESDWLRTCCEIRKLITARNEANNPMHAQITFDRQNFPIFERKTMYTVLFKRQLKPLDHFRYLSKSVLHPFLKKKTILSLSSSKPNSKHYCETT